MTINEKVKPTFGMIVLNGEPFTRYNLRSLYPYAHQIIVVEGACPAAKNIATPDGHSLDGTLQILRDFKNEEDPYNKVTIVTAEDEGHADGFWTEKDEMSQAYAKRATGNYLWQVDSDEFYEESDMDLIIKMLESDPDITSVSFRQITFWGGFDYLADGYYLKNGADIYHRLFKWGPGYSYAGHRPPTVINENGVDLRDIKHVKGETLARDGILMHHYSLLFPKQVSDKCDYYSSVAWTNRSDARDWAGEVNSCLKRPFRVHNVYEYISWLCRFYGEHPTQIENLRNDINDGLIDVRMRRTDDIEALINSRLYSLARMALIMIYPVYRPVQRFYSKFLNKAKRLFSNT